MARVTPSMCARGRSLASPRPNPDGSRVAMVVGAGGRSQLVVAATAGGPETVVAGDAVAGAHAFGGGVLDWAPGGSSLVFVDRGGTLRAVPAEGGSSRLLEHAVDASAPSVAPDGRAVAYVAGERHVAIASLDDGAGAPWPLRVSSGGNDFALDPAWSPDGTALAWVEWDVPAMPWDASRIVVADRHGSSLRVVAGGEGVSVQQPRFSPDGTRLGYLSDATGFCNVWVAAVDGSDAHPVVEERFEHGEPPWGPGQRSWCWSPDGSAIAFCRNEAGFGRLCVVEVASGRVTELAKGVHGGLSWTPAGIVAIRSGATTPDQIVVHDPARPGGDGRRVLAVGPVAFPAETLVEPEAVTWAADDGAEVHGRLYRRAPGPAPLLVWVHGGPTAQSLVTFDPRVAYFLDRGWSVLVPDHRGSSGWGRAYTQAMAGRWGELDADDVAAGMRAAAERGWADPRRMVPIGSSAGGFTVLTLLARHSALCAAGVDQYGVADLLQLDETTHRFERHYLHSLVGPLPEAAERYRERSPVTFAERIRCPLLVLQGDADKVVLPEQSQEVARRVRDAGGTVEVHVYDGEGHGWSRPETVEDALGRIEDFLRRHVLRWRG